MSVRIFQSVTIWSAEFKIRSKDGNANAATYSSHPKASLPNSIAKACVTRHAANTQEATINERRDHINFLPRLISSNHFLPLSIRITAHDIGKGHAGKG